MISPFGCRPMRYWIADLRSVLGVRPYALMPAVSAHVKVPPEVLARL
jgi:hypothetical protein